MLCYSTPAVVRRANPRQPRPGLLGRSAMPAGLVQHVMVGGHQQAVQPGATYYYTTAPSAGTMGASAMPMMISPSGQLTAAPAGLMQATAYSAGGLAQVQQGAQLISMQGGGLQMAGGASGECQQCCGCRVVGALVPVAQPAGGVRICIGAGAPAKADKHIRQQANQPPATMLLSMQ